MLKLFVATTVLRYSDLPSEIFRILGKPFPPNIKRLLIPIIQRIRHDQAYLKC